jgi:acyl-coenzyme A thioesterase PaaI-like protein
MRSVAGPGLTVSSSFTVTQEHRGAPGFAHGGLLALAFDEAFATVCVLLRTRVVTAEIQVSYRRPVPIGSEVYVHTEITGREGRRVLVAGTASLDAPGGPVVAEGSGVYVATGRRAGAAPAQE